MLHPFPNYPTDDQHCDIFKARCQVQTMASSDIKFHALPHLDLVKPARPHDCRKSCLVLATPAHVDPDQQVTRNVLGFLVCA